MAVVRGAEGHDEVVVFPITSARPEEAGAGVEIPPATRARLGLQPEPCWIIITEANLFAWLGPDLRSTESGEMGFTYGSLPSALMPQVKQAFAAWRRRGAVRTIRRTE